jgi:hypothetical protein
MVNPARFFAFAFTRLKASSVRHRPAMPSRKSHSFGLSCSWVINFLNYFGLMCLDEFSADPSMGSWRERKICSESPTRAALFAQICGEGPAGNILAAFRAARLP